MRVLGIDPGEARVGMAISDPGGAIAVPIGVYARKGDRDAEEIAAIAHRELAELIVVGLPILLDGAVGLQARRARRLAHKVERASGLPIVFWDERFTTLDAERHLLDSGMSRKRRRKSVDATAATIILQEYLDCHRESPQSPPV
jgi:putative Holliday junction resolvase